MVSALVTGSTGTVGSELIPVLLDRGMELRSLVHSPEKAPGMEAQGIEVALGDFADSDSIRRALDGITRVFLVAPTDPAQGEWESNLIRIAGEENVERIVKLSIINADPDSELLVYRNHGRSERTLRESGVPHTIMRCSEFMQNLLLQAPDIADNGAIYGTETGTRGVGMVDVRDIAAVAAELLVADRDDDALCTVTGPEAISFATVARELSLALDKELSYVELPPDEFRSALTEAGTPCWLAEALVDLYRSYGRGMAEEVTTTVRDLTGDPARSVRRFATDHAATLLGG